MSEWPWFNLLLLSNSDKKTSQPSRHCLAYGCQSSKVMILDDLTIVRWQWLVSDSVEPLLWMGNELLAELRGHISWSLSIAERNYPCFPFSAWDNNVGQEGIRWQGLAIKYRWDTWTMSGVETNHCSSCLVSDTKEEKVVPKVASYCVGCTLNHGYLW
jgi:hypothetical protein